MARRKTEEEHENHERWMVSYADFLTLLFAFFVVMYAISSVNEGKYRVLSNSLVEAFRSANNEQGITVVNPAVTTGKPVPAMVSQSPRKVSPEVEARRQQYRKQMRNMAEEVMRVLSPLVQGGQVRVTEGVNGISIEINASALFSPGEAVLGGDASRALRAVAEVISAGEFPIKVEGHTDNVPIGTALYPSNWELSASRASSVVRLFVDAGVKPYRLTAAGYADQRPVAENNTPEGKARNRRVTILVETMAPEVMETPVQTTEVRSQSGGPKEPGEFRNVEGALGTPADARLEPKKSP